MPLDFGEDNWAIVTSFTRAGKCVFPCQLRAKILKIWALAPETPSTWRRAGRISRFLEDETDPVVESQVLILNQAQIVVWRDDLVNYYRLSFYPVPWLQSFGVQFVVYRFTGEE